ncbi:circadian clock protein KaiA [Pleurocapsales cyanobacterium LEGE 06147]|nr:circadian clock protein KaiA [Pleurocapsales cyanobacterium LEGE 06147]
MSDNQKINALLNTSLLSRLFICLFLTDEKLTQWLTRLLREDRYCLNYISMAGKFINYIEHYKEQIDCLICPDNLAVQSLLSQLYERGTLLPIVIIEQNKSSDIVSQTSTANRQGGAAAPAVPEGSVLPEDAPRRKASGARDRLSNFQEKTQVISTFYHSAEVRLPEVNLEQITTYINLAITKFLNLAPSCALQDKPTKPKIERQENSQNFLILQQRRLAEKLKERLGYLGVYYKRNFQDFYRNLSPEKKQEFIQKLSADYRQIILNYFSQEQDINQAIDRFVNQAFFADLSVSQILEIHMDLMDEFAQQLKLEGRSEEILLDYRLALIDIIAHLGEMYRRSIPREDIPFELLFQDDRGRHSR